MAIRKDSEWKIHEEEESQIAAIIGTILSPLLIIWVLAWILDINKKGQLIYFTCISTIIIWISLYLWIKSYITASKFHKAKNFKKNWWWITKKVKITSIQPYSRDSSNWTTNYYYLEAEEPGITYCSNDFRVSGFITTLNELPSTAQSELNKLDMNWHITVHYKWFDAKPKIYGLKVHWHTIMVWDIVTVYIDPEDQNNYWMDIDYLFDK